MSHPEQKENGYPDNGQQAPYYGKGRNYPLKSAMGGPATAAFEPGQSYQPTYHQSQEHYQQSHGYPSSMQPYPDLDGTAYSDGSGPTLAPGAEAAQHHHHQQATGYAQSYQYPSYASDHVQQHQQMSMQPVVQMQQQMHPGVQQQMQQPIQQYPTNQYPPVQYHPQGPQAPYYYQPMYPQAPVQQDQVAAGPGMQPLMYEQQGWVQQQYPAAHPAPMAQPSFHEEMKTWFEKQEMTGRADLVQLVSILAQKNGIPSTDCNIENVVKSFCGQQIELWQKVHSDINGIHNMQMQSLGGRHRCRGQSPGDGPGRSARHRNFSAPMGNMSRYDRGPRYRGRQFSESGEHMPRRDWSSWYSHKNRRHSKGYNDHNNGIDGGRDDGTGSVGSGEDDILVDRSIPDGHWQE